MREWVKSGGSLAIVDSQDKANSINYVKSSVLAHFAAGGSSNSVILDAHVVERENQFLAAEADDEAAEDLCLHATRSNAFLKAWKSTRL